MAKKPCCLSGGKGSKTAAGENQVAVAAPTVAAAAADKHNEIIASALGSLTLALSLALCRSNETGDGFW